LAVFLINLTWIIQDTRPQPEDDPHRYLSRTFGFVTELRESEFADTWRLIDTMSFRERPPFYQLLSVPAILILGFSEDAAVLINLIFIPILLFCTFRLGRLVSDSRAGLLAAFLVATYPPIAHLSRIYRPHSVLPACVALSMWLLFLLVRTREIRVAWGFGASLVFGMLMHPNFAYAILGPTLIIGAYLLLFQNKPRYPHTLKALPGWLLKKLRDRFVILGLLPAALFASLVILAWYLPRIDEILTLMRGVQLEFGSVTRGFHNIPHSFWWYAFSAPGAISNVLTVMLVFGIAVCLLRRRLAFMGLVMTFVTMYISFALRVGDFGWLHFSAGLPVVAAVTAIGLVEIRNLRIGPSPPTAYVISKGLVWISIVVAAFNMVFSTWDIGDWSRTVATILGSQHDKAVCKFRMTVGFCPWPALDENWYAVELLEVINDTSECQQRQCALVVVPDNDYFNLSIFESSIMRVHPTLRGNIILIDPGISPTWSRDGEWLISEYIVYISGMLHIDGTRQLRTEITNFLESPPPRFVDTHENIASFPLPGGLVARLIKRTKPLTAEEELRLYEEATRAVPSDVSLLRRLGYLALQMGKWLQAENTFQEALEKDPSLGWAHLASGWLESQKGLYDKSAIQYQMAIETAPFDPQAYRQLSYMLIKQGDEQVAIEVYKLAVKNNPGFTWPLLELGEMYVMVDQIPNAQRAFQNALLLNPWDQEVQERVNIPYWSLASGLELAHVFGGNTELEWAYNGCWTKPYPDNAAVLVGPSILSVDGKSQHDQIHFHPYSAIYPTSINFKLEDTHYNELLVGYGLADEVIERSNGVEFQISVTTESMEQPVSLMDETVKSNEWNWKTLPLVAYQGQNSILQIRVDALQDDSYDWLQIVVRFVANAK
jgi:tetratricopeptide (TPR) repeat protein